MHAQKYMFLLLLLYLVQRKNKKFKLNEFYFTQIGITEGTYTENCLTFVVYTIRKLGMQ